MKKLATILSSLMFALVASAGVLVPTMTVNAGSIVMTPTSPAADLSACKMYRVDSTGKRTQVGSGITAPVEWAVPITTANATVPVKVVAFCADKAGVKTDEVVIYAQWKLVDVTP